MKVKILESSGWYKIFVGSEFDVDVYDRNHTRLPFKISGMGWVYESDCVITELPESFCVKRCDDREKWKKYIKWLNKTYNKEYYDNVGTYYGCDMGSCWSLASPIGTEIHIDDMIKHIDYMESQQHIKGGEQFHKESQLTVNMNKEFDLTTNEGRLAYARQHYPIGTKYIPLDCGGILFSNRYISQYDAKFWEGGSSIEVGSGLIYHNGKWAEIIKEETNMNTQKLSRKGLKEIHSVACPNWKDVLEHYGSRNPLEDYIELTQGEVNNMFDACTKDQLPIVSKYLKQDDGSVDLSKIACEVYLDSQQAMIEIRNRYEYCDKAFWLTNSYDWEIKKDSKGQLCLIPTKKK